MTAENQPTLKGALVGLGNPLLDICAQVPKEFLEKYDIRADNAILAEEKHLPMYQDLIDNHKAEFVAGGATQNSIRVAQWMLKEKKGATAFMGCVGKDKYADLLRKCATDEGVEPHYYEDETTPTGTCAVCVIDGERSLVANLSAANKFVVDHLDHPRSKEIIQDGKFFYIAGFHLTVCPTAIQRLASHAADHDKVFMMNLSAPFIIQCFMEPLAAAIPFCDYIFGNENEATEFGKAKGWGTDVATIALKLSRQPKHSGARGRIVCFTQGDKSTIVAANGKTQAFSVPLLSADKIVDTNGAGDAFVGGFISQLLQDKSLEECVNAGHYAAQVVIGQSGCTFPPTCNYQ